MKGSWTIRKYSRSTIQAINPGLVTFALRKVTPVWNQAEVDCFFYSFTFPFLSISNPAFLSYWLPTNLLLSPPDRAEQQIGCSDKPHSIIKEEERMDERRGIKMYCAPSECPWMIYNTNWRLHEPLGKFLLHFSSTSSSFSSSLTPPSLWPTKRERCR